jgi:tetratricopeptide (TPR) repeat protein
MKLFLSCVSSEFRSYRLLLANHLGAVRGGPYEIKVQEDFQQGGFTLLDRLADYVRECDLVIHLVGDACGARPNAEHLRTLFEHLGETAPDPLPEHSYTQWEYELAQKFGRRTLVYLAAPEAPRDCGSAIVQGDEEARIQREHRARIENSGKHYGLFTSRRSLTNQVFHDLDLGPDRKIANLPYRSLGSLFKGREQFLEQLRETLGSVEHRGHQRVAAITASATAATIHGLGGIGKTRAAIEFAHRYADDYTALLFVQADSDLSLKQNLASMCGPLVLDLAQNDEKELDLQVAAVLRWLQQHPGWFLILDNVDNEEAAKAAEELLAKLTPPAGQILITSRLSGWSKTVETLALDVLSETDAAEFLLERTEGKRRKQQDDAVRAHELAVELGQLALALEQAGAYIARYRSTFGGYMEEWQKRHDRVLEWFDERIMQYPSSVAITWQTSFDLLSEPARRLLQLLSWFAPDPIPESLLEAGGGPFLVEPADGSASDRVADTLPDARDALAELADYSLVKHSDEEPTFALHRLVQDVTRNFLNEGERLPCLKQALRWIDDAFNGDPLDVRNWHILEPLIPHARSIAFFALQKTIVIPTDCLMSNVGTIFFAKAQWSEAELLMRRAMEIKEKRYGTNHPKYAIGLNNLAQLLKITNRLSEAEPLMRRALEIDEENLGPDHPDVAMALHNLALLLQEKNRLNEAEPLMRRALESDEKNYGADHPTVARGLSYLAKLLRYTNRMNEAERMIRRALEIDEKSYGADHPRVAGDLSALAGLLQDTKRLNEAEPLMRRALEIDENCYGADHPRVARDLNNFSTLLRDTNRFNEAEPLIRRALAIDEKNFDADHPRVAIDLNNLVLLLSYTNRPTEAEPLMRRALAINEKSYGSNDPRVATDLNNLSLLLQGTNQLKEAEPLLRRALSIDEKSSGTDNPRNAILLMNLARLFKGTNRLNEAEPIMQRALNIFLAFKRDCGHEHPSFQSAACDYDQLLQEMGLDSVAVNEKLEEIGIQKKSAKNTSS